MVHLAVADVVNDAHGYEFWMTSDALAAKTRTNPGNARKYLAALVADGLLEVLDPGGGRNRATRYRFLFPIPRSRDAVCPEEAVDAETAKPRNEHAKPRRDNARNSIELKERTQKREPRPHDAVSAVPLAGTPAFAYCDECGVRGGVHRHDCPELETKAAP